MILRSPSVRWRLLSSAALLALATAPAVFAAAMPMAPAGHSIQGGAALDAAVHPVPAAVRRSRPRHHTPRQGRSHDALTTAAAMFKTQIDGPYAMSVRDGLNAMMIDSRLVGHGVHVKSDDSGGLASVMTALPSMLPTAGYISSDFGVRHSPFTGALVHHNGVDFAVPYGSPVRATADGVVTSAGWHHYLGKLVTIDHGFGIVTRYGHNSTILAKVGQHVHRGDQIARAGSTGRSTGSHVHYEVWLNGQVTDPADFMFDIPANSADLVASEQRGIPGLGFAVGGDEEEGEAMFRAKAVMPTTAERLPINLGITGGFLLLTLLLVGSLLPAMRHEYDDGLGL